MIKSTLRRSIRRAQVHDLIGRNLVELIDLPSGQPGPPSRAMTQDQAAKVLRTASGNGTGYVKVAMCSDKTARNYRAALCLAATLHWLNTSFNQHGPVPPGTLVSCAD